MKRRVILILTILAVLIVVVGGIAWYIRRNDRPRMRARIAVEIQARNYGNAVALAASYVDKYPDDWQGYYARAEAYAYQGRYDEARGDLQKMLAEADHFRPDKTSVTIMLANTYSMPARRALAAADASLETIDRSIEGIRKAIGILESLSPSSKPVVEDKRAIDARETIGINQAELGVAYRNRSVLLAREAQIAQAAGGGEARAAREKESAASLAESQNCNAQALQTLLGVVKTDPSRQDATQTLVTLCVESGDQDSLSEARDAILGLKNPPPLATMMLLKQELLVSRRSADLAEHRKKLQQACVTLDGVLARTDLKPDEASQLKLGRAELAMEAKDFATAERLIGEVLGSNPRQAEARFVHARLLMEQGRWELAERELFTLKTDFSNFVGAQLLYAQAAERSGKTDMVRDVMRAITKISPRNATEQGYVAAAWRYLAGSMLKEGIYKPAFQDAQDYYRQFPADPQAVRLFAEAALRTNQDYLARETLAKAVKEHSDDPVMLMAACDGYGLIGDKAAAAETARQAAECKPDSPERRLAVARAMALAARSAEAEKLLAEELARDWQQPQAHFILAQIYWTAGRQMQALEQYRAAVQLDEQNQELRLALAQRLFEIGDLDACQTVLEQSDRANPITRLLFARVKLARGEPLDEESAVGASGGGAVVMALDYLRGGQPAKAVEICLNELKPDKTPDNHDARAVLAQAYAALGQDDKAIEQLSEILKAAPDQLAGYQALATALAHRNPPDVVVETLSKVPGAQRPMVDMTAGWMFSRLGLNARAGEAFSRVVDNPAARDYDRSLARLYRASATARAGQTAKALEELDSLAAQEAWRRQALLGKAELLLTLGRAGEAKPVLSQMRSLAVQARDTQWLVSLVTLQARARAFDEALATCDDIVKLRPDDARSFLAKAVVLEGAGKAPQAVEAYRQAIALQPGNFSIYTRLARAYDAQCLPIEAMATLEQLATVSKLAQEAALWERGNLLAGWGLQQPAAECFQRLDQTSQSQNPQIQLALGEALARLGRKDAAKAALAKIPQYAQAYLPAQELMARLAETTEAKLEILRQARKVKSDAERLLAMEMAVLMGAQRPGEAVQAYQSFAAALAGGRALAQETHYLAIEAMLQAGQRKEAAQLCRLQAQQTRTSRWRQLAALLGADDDLPSAMALLGEPDKAEFADAVLGAALAGGAGKHPLTEQWCARIDQIEADLARSKPPQAIPPSYGLLAALVSGQKSQAVERLARLSTLEPVSRSVAEAIVHRDDGTIDIRSQAARIMLATSASDLQLPFQCRTVAMEILKSDPTCQWAAMLIVQRTEPDVATLHAVLELLQPKECLLARTIAASEMTRRKEYDQAAGLYGQLAASQKDNPAFLLFQAGATENAGHLEEALDLYRKVYQVSGEPSAANNAAYIITRLWPKDAARLAEAATMIESAVKAQPQVASFRDTLGYVAYLQGRTEEAERQLYQAVKGLPDVLEVHYHLGLAESAAKRNDMARWHFQAAVELGKKLTADSGELPPGTKETAQLAQQALNGLESTGK